ncbi:palmitoyl-monogalactosyldiacylglycerol delta-7 desaturase chloroplastic-like [Prunus yedoensis var. nudiflora]|uniref:Palmitoyl-monogalactosyldiacylglycerol delta-7 desaturase chloroplastic-like n=1 Tax=Prunus yedoensis var. nudiflora TaxID=2094558 RepID=A0A314XQQ6_PRUYE|nr:palmitoyl-monogalactosyldiacylglycerol delta-7 desaturase chloroplastic-like [Prunus yedoensis var. nudiflora]
MGLLGMFVRKLCGEFLGRKWNIPDVFTAVLYLALHWLSVFAPFHFNWPAFWVAITLYVATGLGITLGYHRSLAHRSLRLPKWLEYFFAYCGILSLQLGGLKNVEDLRKQPFYRFLHRTYLLHSIALGGVLYVVGGFPSLVWGVGVRTTFFHHATFLVNSVGHMWGNKAWNTGDMSTNNWWLAIIMFGEGWHNNHHAFEYSARHGLEWWQIDFTWYTIRFLQAIGLATDVKVPTEIQKQRKATNGRIMATQN